MSSTLCLGGRKHVNASNPCCEGPKRLLYWYLDLPTPPSVGRSNASIRGSVPVFLKLKEDRHRPTKKSVHVLTLSLDLNDFLSNLLQFMCNGGDGADSGEFVW